MDTIFDRRVENSPTSEFVMEELVDKTAGNWGGDLKKGAANKFLKIALDCIAEKNNRPYITSVVERLETVINDNNS